MIKWSGKGGGRIDCLLIEINEIFDSFKMVLVFLFVKKYFIYIC